VIRKLGIGILAAAAGLWSCEEPAALVCPDILRPSVAVTVTDSATNLSTITGSKLKITSGAYADSMSANIAFPQLFAGDRPGTFDVLVTKQDFGDWTRPGIVVQSDRCGQAETVELTARLQRILP
jgi:hypothetical protein